MKALTNPMGKLVDVVIEDARWDAIDLVDLAEKSAVASLHMLNLDPSRYEIALLGCDDVRIAVLNGDFREKPHATNVLSWPSQDHSAKIDGDMPPMPSEPMDLGDIAIAFGTCALEAETQNKPFSNHISHLLAHATLHLLGFDHIREKDAALMEGLEVKILASLGIADPY
jgi:probable rRNA maturation factor